MDVVAYVDGLNLYYGLKSKYGYAYFWLDIVSLIRRIRDQDKVLKVRYFTAIVKGDPEAIIRQETYLAALSAYSPELEITRGYIQKKSVRCGGCRSSWRCSGCEPPETYRRYEEKLTDVALSAALIKDAARGYGDLSLLVSADADFQPAVEATLDLAPSRRVVIVCPPGRTAPRQSAALDVGIFHLRKQILRDSQLPERVYDISGKLYERPAKWSHPAPVVA